MGTYEAFIVDSAPRWLRKTWGQAFLRAFGSLADAAVSAAKLAAKARFPSVCPPDALQEHGHERQLPRPPGYDDRQYRSLLSQSWTLWAMAGTDEGVKQAVMRLGYPTVEVWSDRAWPQGDATRWARFVVVIKQPHPFLPSVLWGQADIKWAPDKNTWGSSATVQQVENVRNAVRKWQAGHAVCQAIVVIFSGSAPTPGTGDWETAGTWGGSAILWRMPREEKPSLWVYPSQNFVIFKKS